jgi:hypothetical protein
VDRYFTLAKKEEAGTLTLAEKQELLTIYQQWEEDETAYALQEACIDIDHMHRYHF